MQISARSEMEMDLFDAVIRRFKEIDDRLYDQKLYQRWRHFLEADFMVTCYICTNFIDVF